MKLQYNIEDLSGIAKTILNEIKTPSNVCFNGPMGVGKTTLIKKLIRQLGAVDAGSSPTFGLVNEYADENGEVLAYHFDFYRINDTHEALDIGFEDYIASGKWMFIEWPEKISDLIPPKSIYINMYFVDKNEHLNDENVRFIEISNS